MGNLWAIMFFMMLFTLGLDSQFGTLQGVVQGIIDVKLCPNIRKEIITGHRKLHFHTLRQLCRKYSSTHHR
ncbi:Transporter, partial [Caligus rogercresseyi]